MGGKEDGLDDEQMNNRCVLAGQGIRKGAVGLLYLSILSLFLC